MPQTEVEALVAAITDGIAVRGAYMVFDKRLDLICGRGCSKNPDHLRTIRAVEAFAISHQWSATIREGSVVFRPAAD